NQRLPRRTCSSDGQCPEYNCTLSPSINKQQKNRNSRSIAPSSFRRIYMNTVIPSVIACLDIYSPVSPGAITFRTDH
ncbi:hypothetical protein, partial [Pseudomonas syringae]|uniref:hypothetical protein n=1 Tax=Pseudomonas syringae TaxID=317 RepID=UPI00217DA7A8